ncbi:MAG: PspC domain-containing protein [Candidatus Nanopelagicales bacterium]
MDTMHAPTPAPARWFSGLRRSHSRVLGGVASGFADFWLVDPVLLRVLLVSPFAAALTSLVLVLVLGSSVAVLLMQLLGLGCAGVLLAYLLAWLLIPQTGADSLARRFLDLGGPVASVVKGLVLIVGLCAIGWLALVILVVLSDQLAFAVGALVVVAGAFLGLLALALFAAWSAPGGDPRGTIRRFGSRGFGRVPSSDAGSWDDPGAPHDDPTLVLGDPLTATPDDPTLVLGNDSAPTLEPPAAGHAAGQDDPRTGPPHAPMPPQHSVDRARAAATAQSDARAAEAEAERRMRTEQRRARRSAARAVRRDRNRWGTLVAALTLIAAGGLFLTDRMGLTSLGVLGVGVVCLGVLSAGVVVGAWFGSARWLIAPALLLSAALGGSSYLSTSLDDAATAAPVRFAPERLPPDQQTTMHWDNATVTVDLTGTRTLDDRMLGLSLDRGTLTVIVPADQWVIADGQVLWGRNLLDPGREAATATLFSTHEQVLNQPADAEQPTTRPLFLDLSVTLGELTLIAREA